MLSWYTRYVRKCVLFSIIPFESFQCMGVGLTGQNGECVTNRAIQARKHACATATIQLQSSEVINVWGYGLNTWNVTTILVKVWFDLSIFSHKKRFVLNCSFTYFHWIIGKISCNDGFLIFWWVLSTALSWFICSVVNFHCLVEHYYYKVMQCDRLCENWYYYLISNSFRG